MGESIVWGLVLAAALSVVIGLIEVGSRAAVKRLPGWPTSAFLVYLVVLIVGNAATTMVAASVVQGFIESPDAGAGDGAEAGVLRRLLAAAPWFWYAFFGVFAFEALIQRLNVTFFDQGVLTLNDWITKARDRAVAATISADGDRQIGREQLVAELLRGDTKLTDDRLNAYVQSWLGPGRVKELEDAAGADGADPRLVKCLALASGAFGQASRLAGR
jgi:hypothetical protein